MRTIVNSLRFGLLFSLLAAVGCGKSPSSSASSSPTPGAPAAKTLVVGFAQVGSESGWRSANTDSFKNEAAARGIDLRFSDADNKPDAMIAAMRAYIQQKVDVIIFSAIVETGWDKVLTEAKAAGIPVIVEDRRADVPDDLYASFIGSDFVLEGKRAGDWLVKNTGGKATIAVLEGTTGSAPANDRAKGFAQAIAAYPDMKIIWSQTGNFKTSTAKEAFDAFLKTPDAKKVTALFAHNDDMALGAIQAMEEAGIKPGKDITIVSIDGEHDGLAAVLAGKLNCSVECTPLLGPKVFDIAKLVVAGLPVDKRIVVDETVFDQSNLTQAILDARKY
jgi:galactofuranose transport system substrate-binding protein